MVLTAALIIPLLALWLWWPVSGLNGTSRLSRLIAVLITTLLGIAPALLLKAVQTGALPYALVSRLQVPGGWVLSTLLMLAVFVLLRDLLWLIASLTGRRSMAQILHIPALTMGAVVATAGLSAIGVFNALQPPKVHDQTLAVRNLPPALEGLRIAVLADIHASPVNDAQYVNTIVERTLAAAPDLIVLPGDMVDGDVATSRASVAPLAKLTARYGVWAAPGNHEYYSGYNAWMEEFHRLGLNLLENRSQLLQIKGSKLALSGIGDPVYGRTSPNNANPAMVMHRAVDRLAAEAPVVLDRVAGVLLIADGDRFPTEEIAHYGSAESRVGHVGVGHIVSAGQAGGAIPAALHGRVVSVCDAGDPVCDPRSVSLDAYERHTGYKVGHREARDAAEHVAALAAEFMADAG